MIMSYRVKPRIEKRKENSYPGQHDILCHETCNEKPNTKQYTILTYIFGDAEILRDPLIVDFDVEYVCVTDRNDLTSKVWTIKKFNKFSDAFSNVLYVRYHPYEFVSTEKCITMDGSFLIKKHLRGLLSLLDSTDMLLLDHPERFDLNEEIDTWVKYRNYPLNHAEDWKKELKDYDMKGLVELAILSTKKTETNVSFLNEVYDFCMHFHQDNKIERCDQVAFSYLLNTRNKMNVKILNHDIVSSSTLEHFIHNTMIPSNYGKRTTKETTFMYNVEFPLSKPITVSVYVVGHENCKYAYCDDSYYYFNRSKTRYNDEKKKELNVFDVIKDNNDDDDIVGLVQYRRYFIEDDHDLNRGIHTIARRQWIVDNMHTHDVILAKKYALFPQINSFRDIFTPVCNEDRPPFVMEHIHNFFLMIRDKDKNFGDFIFKALFNMNYHFNDNMIICKKSLLMKYYDWFDDIANEYIAQEKPEQDRIYTWMSEFIMGYWFMYNGYKIYEASRVQYDKGVNIIEMPNCSEEEAAINYSKLPTPIRRGWFKDLNRLYEHNK